MRRGHTPGYAMLAAQHGGRISRDSERRGFRVGLAANRKAASGAREGPLMKKPGAKTSPRGIKKVERAEGQKGLRQQSGDSQ
jgi:hypothetical protein